MSLGLPAAHLQLAKSQAQACPNMMVCPTCWFLLAGSLVVRTVSMVSGEDAVAYLLRLDKSTTLFELNATAVPVIARQVRKMWGTAYAGAGICTPCCPALITCEQRHNPDAFPTRHPPLHCRRWASSGQASRSRSWPVWRGS